LPLQDLRVTKDKKDLLVLKDLKVQRHLQVLKVQKVLKVLLVTKDQRDLKEIAQRGQKDRKVVHLLDQRVLRVTHPKETLVDKDHKDYKVVEDQQVILHKVLVVEVEMHTKDL